MKDLLQDVGISRHNTRYYNVSDTAKWRNRDDQLFESDKQITNLGNSRFTMLDMTDYESDFASYVEIPELRIEDNGALPPWMIKTWPKTDTQIEVADLERLP